MGSGVAVIASDPEESPGHVAGDIVVGAVEAGSSASTLHSRVPIWRPEVAEAVSGCWSPCIISGQCLLGVDDAVSVGGGRSGWWSADFRLGTKTASSCCWPGIRGSSKGLVSAVFVRRLEAAGFVAAAFLGLMRKSVIRQWPLMCAYNSI